MNEYADIMQKRRPASNRAKMAVRDRAKIFAPYSALRGYEESTRARTRLFVPRRILAEDEMERLDRRLRSIARGGRAAVTVFRAELERDGEELGTYLTVTGTFTGIDAVSGALVLKEGRIPLGDIADIAEG